MAEVYQREGSPYWYYDITNPVTGKRERKSTKRKNKKEAATYAAVKTKEYLDQFQLGVKVEKTLQEVIDLYLDTVATKADYENIKGRAKKLLGGLEGRFGLDPNMKFSALRTADVMRLRAARAKEGNKANTINNEVKVIRAALSVAVAHNIAVPKELKVIVERQKGKLRYFTREEADRLIKELDPSRPIPWRNRWGASGTHTNLSPLLKQQMQDAYDLAVFLLDTGCRYSEIATIPWDVVDIVNWEWIDIYRSKVDNESILYMTPRLKEVLKRRYAARGNHAYVFPGYSVNDEGELIDTHRGKATKAIRKAIERAKLNEPHLVQRYGRATVHTLRDTFASWLVQSGMSLFMVQKLLGHSDPRQTQKYAKLVANDVSIQAVKILAQMTGQIRADI